MESGADLRLDKVVQPRSLESLFLSRCTLKTNIHSVERIVRIGVGLVLTSLAFVGPANLWFLLGLIPLATGIIGWCPPYYLLGISTCRVK
jgi:hypothetical protein